MPDWVSHLIAGHITSRVSRGSFVYAALLGGAVLPDVISYLPWKAIALSAGHTELTRTAAYFTSSLHSLPAGLVTALCLSFLFREELRPTIFTSLSVGSILHMFMDLFQYQLDGGYLLFAPLSYRTFQFGPFWGDYWPFWIAALTPVALLIEIRRWLSKHSSSQGVF